MRLVFLGAPASGKGTQAQRLAGELTLPKVSTGDMLRAALAEATELGKEAARFMAEGALVPDPLIIRLVAERLAQEDACSGFILDGFPRTEPQAVALEELLQERGFRLDGVLQLDVPRELLIERASGRRTDVQTGQIYHLKYNPPPHGAALEQRADDREETVVRRLDVYDRETAALHPYFARQGLLHRIDGSGTPEQVAGRVREVVGLLHSDKRLAHSTISS